VATIFISFTYKDADTAKLIKKFLDKRFERQVSAFLACDPIDISPGEKWDDSNIGRT
jgi:hypothetical protein